MLRQQLGDRFLQFRLVPKTLDLLIAALHEQAERIRTHEKEVMSACVNGAQMPRKTFITSFPQNETRLEWVDEHIQAGKKYSPLLTAQREAQLIIDSAHARAEIVTWDKKENAIEELPLEQIAMMLHLMQQRFRRLNLTH